MSIDRPVASGGALAPQFLAQQLTLSQRGGADYAHHSTTNPPGFSDLATALLWQYGLWSFPTGYTKLERFLHKNQHTQRKLLNFENWTNGEPQ